MAISESIVIKMTAAEHLLEDLVSANEMLDEIKNGVNTYLEGKRLSFPRLFFLSNSEMLEMLSETKNPQNIQPFLCRCFDGIHRVELNENDDANAMLSSINEKINFQHEISISAFRSVEKWLLNIESEMRASIQNEMINSYADYITSQRVNWILSWPQMIVLTIAHTFWTSDIHASLLQQNHDLLINIRDEMCANLSDIIDVIRSADINNLDRMTLKSLCIMDLYARDVVETLFDNKNIGIDDFQWIAQLRYYWIDNEVNIKMFNASVSFGYEYLGNFQRIVMTPLTERCYRTVFLALQHQMNTSIEGPTAVGKTETIKDLARRIAVQFKLFHCTADLDYTSISKFLKGIVSNGAW